MYIFSFFPLAIMGICPWLAGPSSKGGICDWTAEGLQLTAAHIYVIYLCIPYRLGFYWSTKNEFLELIFPLLFSVC